MSTTSKALARGARHPRWNDKGRVISDRGYVRIRLGIDHPLADASGWAYEHLIVWCTAGNKRPASGATLHHVNGDRIDNRLENLVTMSASEHARQHATARARNQRGQFQ